MQLRRRHSVWALLLVLAAGCSVGSPVRSDGATAATPNVGGGGAAPATVATCPEQLVPWTSLRRLTRFEYQNAVRDLLNVDVAAAEALPADEVTNSFDNNAEVLTVSALHAEKYVLVSEALAKLAVEDLPKLVGCDAASLGEQACAEAFAQRLARRAFRRPATALDQQNLLAAYTAGRTGGSYAEGIEVMVRAALQSPDFLYRLETASAAEPSRTRVALDPYQLATRLSFLIWSSIPDDALLDAAERGELSRKDQVAAKARQMLADPRARAAIGHFFAQWTGSQRLEITTKSEQLFPSFTAELRSAMRAELPAFVEHVLWTGDHSLHALLTEPTAFVNAPLAELYGVAAPAASGAGLLPVALPASQGRAGLLTQAGFLAVQAHPDQTSPVLRGKFVRSMLLCQPPPPPPPDVDISLPPVAQGTTARERLAGHLAAGASCSGCHSLMDPIGLAFEHFDALGRYRDSEDGAAIDTSGQISGVSDAQLGAPFTGVAAMAEQLAASPEVRACVATQWFRFASGRFEADADQCALSALRDAFGGPGGDFLELIVATTQTDAFLFRSTP